MDERGATSDVWRIYNPTEYEMLEGWQTAQVEVKPFTSGIDYWIIFGAIKGRGEDGYVAIDNLDFLKESNDCPTLPAMAEPVVCQPGEIECGDHTCISEVKYFYTL